MTDVGVNVIRLDADGCTSAVSGYDHSWFAWCPTPQRPALRWPDGARVAVCVVLDLGAVEWERSTPSLVPPPGGRGVGPPPDIPRMSHREFGHRVGVFRLLDMARRNDIPLAAAVDVLTARRYPPLLAHLRRAVAEFLAAGLSASRPITSRMSDDEERDYIEVSMAALADLLGARPKGWIGPEQSESWRTPRLLADAGLDYIADWGNDDRPYPMLGASPRLWSCPLSWELSDLSATYLRQVSADDYAASVVDAVDRLCDESVTSGRMLGLHLHPWLSGQAFRADAVETVFARLGGDDRIWVATPAEIIDWCRGA